jgi:hypothetical protein
MCQAFTTGNPNFTDPRAAVLFAAHENGTAEPSVGDPAFRIVQVVYLFASGPYCSFPPLPPDIVIAV